MKDSQDWLVDITSLYAGYYAGKVTLGELYDGVDGIVRKHILQEALEIVDSVQAERVTGLDLVSKQMVRNKFNDTWGGGDGR